ncbi:predicted GPI-anchored protein 58 [Alosa sapidissima]|uniref:predicted GPI-anchored protein 58 n=1 Tax=Alosa sapidissima TaxID=34773 RepID=UPI001C087871|nr:predicted GPI-anchored protein 58 [Alosa sapidissima]
MTSTRIQLYEVNQRTLTQWHNQRSKAMMRDTIAIAVPGPSAPQTAAEPLPAPRTLLQHPEQPDQPLQHHLPTDASGLAATIRGPLAPELYDLITASSSTASSSSSTATPQTSTAPSTSASADATAGAETGATSSAAAAATAPTVSRTA